MLRDAFQPGGRQLRTILGGVLAAGVCGLLYAAFRYAVGQLFSEREIRFGLFVALAGCAFVAADGLAQRGPRRAFASTGAPHASD